MVDNGSGKIMKPDPWVSLEEPAQHLGLSQDTIHRWLRNRDMPTHQAGRLWEFKVSEVYECVQAGRKPEDESDEKA
jgi:excisionase family DNA binding protein